ncbi:MAG: hypothetical protein GC160_06655 [Acidobacteria bacterium]|nr:hypothetical protein [Acidobacteriota bacterium]
MRSAILLLLAGLVVPPIVRGAEAQADFETGDLSQWLVPLPRDWKLVSEDGNRFLRLEKPGPVGNPRRPTKFALWKADCVGDFKLTVRVRRIDKSLLVAFGYQNRSRFYYAHISSDDGNHSVHNGLFKVHGGSRFRIAGVGSAPALPDQDWHTIRIERTLADDRIAVFVDDDKEPRFEAIDGSFRFGRVGLGSFDETGDFDDFHLEGESVEGCPASDYSPLDPS